MEQPDIKAKFRSQLTDKKEVQVNDTRNHGLKRIYFFRRQADDFIFPLDSELEAHHLMRRKDFPQKFEFVGWSNGKHFAEYERGGATRVEYDEEANVSDKGQTAVDGKKQLYNEMIALEFEEAVDNPDKTPPRDFRIRDLGGNVADGQMSGWLKMMR